jgi:Zn-dependent peptidase ImmA (M78 family)
MIGHRLKLSRAGAGLSLRDLEAKIGNRVSAQALSKYERDEMMPSSAVLMSLASALGVSEGYLLGDQQMQLDGVEFRKKAPFGQREVAQIEAKVLERVEKYLAVEELLGLSVDWEKPREAPYPVREVVEADRAAHLLRDSWGLGLDPIPKLAELLEEKGIKVLSIDAEKFDGLTAQVQRENKAPMPVIVIDCKDWAERKRFNFAHELGHMVMELESSVDSEKAAHRFASAFLMPAETLWREVGRRRTSISLGELLQLKQRFGASFQAIAYRCWDLGIIGRPVFKELFELFKAHGWRDAPFEEPGAINSHEEEPRRFERLCYRAVSEGAISEAKAAELLGISVRELGTRLDEPQKIRMQE